MSDGDRGQIDTSRQWNDRLQAIVVMGILTMAAFTTGVVMFFGIPAVNAQLVGQIQGSLWLAVGTIIQRFFGRSTSSDQKDATIATQAQAIQTAQQLPPPDPTGPVIPVKEGKTVTVEGVGNGGT